jgi:hypothetical protein
MSRSSTVTWPILRWGASGRLAVECTETPGMASAARRPRMTGRPLCRLGTEQVDHGRRAEQLGAAERQAGDGAQVLLELVGEAGLDGVVAGVVGARGDLVDEQLAGRRSGTARRRRCRRRPGPRRCRIASRAAAAVAASMRAGASSMSRMFCSRGSTSPPADSSDSRRPAAGDHDRQLLIRRDEALDQRRHRQVPGRSRPARA